MPDQFACFVSYSDQDRVAAERVRGSLLRRGLPVFVDRHSIEAGNQWRAEIRNGISRSKAVVVLVSQHSINSGPVLEELTIANAVGTPVIPVILEEGCTDAPSPISEHIAEKQWIRFPKGVTTRTSDFDLEGVVRAVRRKWHPTAPVIAVSNLKGGVGKTTLAAHVFSALSNNSKLSILLIDLDPQANLSQFVLPQDQLFALVEDDKSVLSLFERSLVYGAASPRNTLIGLNPSPIEDVAIFDIAAEVGSSPLSRAARVEAKPVFLIPGQFELVKYTLSANSHGLQTARSNFMNSINAAQKEFDVIVIDLNPSSSFMIECALTAATHVLCPMRPDKYSIQGLLGMKRLIADAFALQRKPSILGVFNGVPSWDNLVDQVRSAIDDPQRLGSLGKDKKVGNCIEPILEVLGSQGMVTQLLNTEIPESPMLKAFFDDSSAGFFGLARFNYQGSYGAKLRRRLETLASEIAQITGAEALDVPKA